MPYPDPPRPDPISPRLGLPLLGQFCWRRRWSSHHGWRAHEAWISRKTGAQGTLQVQEDGSGASVLSSHHHLPREKRGEGVLCAEPHRWQETDQTITHECSPRILDSPRYEWLTSMKAAAPASKTRPRPPTASRVEGGSEAIRDLRRFP
jgi:hypothetical protein